MKASCKLVSISFIFGMGLFIVDMDAQPYHPMPSGPAQWNMARCWYFYPAGWHDLYYITMDGTDTFINQKVYKKLYHTTHHAPGTEFDSTYTHFLGGMREEGKKVFMISEWLCLDTIERLIYDFNDVSSGDIIYTQVLTNGLTQFIQHNVTGVDEVDVNGTPRRQIHLTDENGFFNETWIEGIGSSMGLLYATYWQLTDNSYDLNCFYEGVDLQYTNPSPAYAFCTSPFPDSECAPVITSADPGPELLQVKLFPNPVFSSLFIEGSTNIETVQVFNGLGVKIMEVPFAPELETAKLPSGFYLLRFTGKLPGQYLVQRIVKI
jgi:hypothetical protein